MKSEYIVSLFLKSSFYALFLGNGESKIMRSRRMRKMHQHMQNVTLEHYKILIECAESEGLINQI